jgi:hypothetical protein
MTEPLPFLREDQIGIDADAAIATATFIFVDGMKLPVEFCWPTLRDWATRSRAGELKGAVLDQ